MDDFSKLDINDKYGITNVVPLSAYDVARLEGHDLTNPQLVQFQITPHMGAQQQTYDR